MKTKTFFSVIGLALILAFANTVFAGGISKGNAVNTSIRYTVNIQYTGAEAPMLSSYVVKIYNEKHHAVAPAQVLIPGKSQYVFFERGPADGIRIAMIEKSIIDGGIEPWWTLVCEPAIVKGPFEVGKNYRFDLFPKVLKERE
jgi:hypothetical protein